MEKINSTTLIPYSYIDFGQSLDSCLQQLNCIKREEIPKDSMEKLKTLNVLLQSALQKQANLSCSRGKSIQKHNVPLPKPFLCPLCYHSHHSYKDLKEHMFRCVPTSWKGQKIHRANFSVMWNCLKCKTCKSEFSDYDELEKHKTDSHPQNTNQLLFCVPCSFNIIFNKEYYQNHVSSILHRHSKYTSNFFKQFGGILSDSCYRCFICSKSSSIHVRCRHPLEKNLRNLIYCKVCDVIFPSKKMNLHLEKDFHLSYPWFPTICPICGVCVTGKYNLLRHVNMHRTKEVEALPLMLLNEMFSNAQLNLSSTLHDMTSTKPIQNDMQAALNPPSRLKPVVKESKKEMQRRLLAVAQSGSINIDGLTVERQRRARLSTSPDISTIPIQDVMQATLNPPSRLKPVVERHPRARLSTSSDMTSTIPIQNGMQDTLSLRSRPKPVVRETKEEVQRGLLFSNNSQANYGVNAHSIYTSTVPQRSRLSDHPSMSSSLNNAAAQTPMSTPIKPSQPKPEEKSCCIS